MKSPERNQYPTVTVAVAPQYPAPLVDKISDDEIYYGYASLFTSEDEKLWLIVRVTVDGTVIRTEYPNSEMVYNQAWSERATLTYSR